MHAKISHTHVKDPSLLSMLEFGGLCKHQNNPACTESVKTRQKVEVGHCTTEEESLPSSTLSPRINNTQGTDRDHLLNTHHYSTCTALTMDLCIIVYYTYIKGP